MIKALVASLRFWLESPLVCHLPAGGWPAIFGIPWLVDVGVQSLPLPSQAFSLYVPVFMWPSYRTPVLLDSGPPDSRRTSSQLVTSAMTQFSNQVTFRGPKG